jgi:hypothetical protein
MPGLVPDQALVRENQGTPSSAKEALDARSNTFPYDLLTFL